MPLSPETQERHARDLARFQALAMRAAEKVGDQLDAAADPVALASLVSSLHKAGRTLRQSIALEARLARDAERDARDLDAGEQARRERAVETRKAQVRDAVERLIWTEYEDDDAAVFTAELAERLDLEALDADFLDQPLEAQVERLSEGFDLTGEPPGPYIPRAFRSRGPGRRLPEGFFDHYFANAKWENSEDDGAAPAAPTRAPGPTNEPAPGRLTPPMDLPSTWDSG